MHRIILILCVCCAVISTFAQKTVKIIQIESINQVELRYDSIRKVLRGIAIPLEFEVIFNRNDSLWFSDAYNYIDDEFGYTKNNGGWKMVLLRVKIGEKYVTQASVRHPQQSDTCYYWVGTIHNFKSDSDLQDSLSQYVVQMKKESIASLNVGTLSQFKKKHPKIVERILKNDSIGFDIRQQPRKFIDFITVPIEK